jgi:hypothetical protein
VDKAKSAERRDGNNGKLARGNGQTGKGNGGLGKNSCASWCGVPRYTIMVQGAAAAGETRWVLTVDVMAPDNVEPEDIKTGGTEDVWPQLVADPVELVSLGEVQPREVMKVF